MIAMRPGPVLAVACLLCAWAVQAQIAVTGVLTYKGKPLQDGYISYDTIEVFTDSLGRFALTVDSVGAVLYIGKLDHRSMAYTVRRAGHHAIKLPRKYGRRSQRQRICGFCFTGEALVTLGDGSCERIDRLRPGAIVSSLQGEHLISTRVCSVDHFVHDELVKLRFSDGVELTSTQDHPFLVKGKGWCSVQPSLAQIERGVSTAHVGDSCLRLIQGGVRYVPLVLVERLYSTANTFNITVSDGAEAFFVNGLFVSDESLFNRAPSRKSGTDGSDDGSRCTDPSGTLPAPGNLDAGRIGMHPAHGSR